MYLADTLSQPSAASSENIRYCFAVEPLQYVETQVAEMLDPWRWTELFDATRQNTTSRKCLEYLAKRWPDKQKLDAELTKLYDSCDMITSYQGLIMFKESNYMPSELRPIYLTRFHESHQGIKRMRVKMRQFNWWPSMSGDINNYVSRCNVCIRYCSIKHQPMERAQLHEALLLEIGFDAIEHQSNLYLVMMDYYFRWIEVPKIQARTSCLVIQAMRPVFARQGMLKLVRSDNGLCFAS